MSHINPTSSIRSGFDYQDFWGLRLLGQWLVDPHKYKWIQFETCPDDIDPNKFYLDDIVCLDSADHYCLYQTKHRQDATDAWTWDNFLLPIRSGGTSLLKKWAQSLLPRIDKTKEAFFITNGQAAEEVNTYLRDEKLDIERIKRENSSLYARIVAETGTDQKLDRLFQILHFRFGQEDLSEDKLENNIRRFFYENLNATESGVTNLFYEIKKECRSRQTRHLDIETVRKWCEFDIPRPLNEQFSIPSDFEFFDKRTHELFLSDLQKPEGGIKVIAGKPGVGKSVYLSKLAKELNRYEIISVKHHYHVSPEDSNPQERLNAERVIEAMKAQFKSHREELGNLANKNSKEIPIREFVTTVATGLSRSGKAFVIIIDGLDHALRYGPKEELETFLGEICYPQPGVWIVIGMQESARLHLPQIVLDQCPEDSWTRIRGLSKDAVARLISSNKAEIHLPEQPKQFDSLAEKLFSITEGNPLHLRYSVQQLKNLCGKSLVMEYSCNDLIPYSNGIEKYYESLWNQIPAKAKTILLTIASVNFLFTGQQLIECVSLSTANPSDVTSGFNGISHLITKNLRGQLTVYHNSFDVFLRERPELKQQKIVIKTNVKKWLEQSNYDYLKWAELRVIEYDLGNSGPILQIDRQWLLDAICYPSNSDQISYQMSLAGKIAFEKGDFANALQVSYLHTYYLNSKDFVEDATELIWREALQHNPAVLDYIDFSTLPANVLPTLAKFADDKGNTLAVREIIDILTDRLDKQEYRQNTVPRVTAALLEVLPYDRQHTSRRVHKYVVQFRDLRISDKLFGIYTRQLLCLGQKENLESLLKLELTDAEKESIFVECAKHGFVNNADDVSEYFPAKESLPLQCQVYKFLKTHTAGDLPALPQYDIFPQTIREYDIEERARWSSFFHHQFLAGLLYGLTGGREEIEKWIKDAPNPWPAQAAGKLLEAGTRIAGSINGLRFAYADLFDPVSSLDELKWPEDRDALSFQHAFKDSLKQVLSDVLLLMYHMNIDVQIKPVDYSTITAKPPFFSKEDFTDLILDADMLLLTNTSYEVVRDENISRLAATVGYFPDRAVDYVKISKIARLYGDDKSSRLSLKKASDNLLGYGYHKDVYLFEVLEAIEFCALNATSKHKINDWLTRIIPLVANVKEYTDGDETRHLPLELADILAQHNPGLLYRYYFWSAHREDFYQAEDLFKYVLKSFPFDDDVQVALASTAADEDSFLQLKVISQTNAGAAVAVRNIESYLGQVSYQKEKEHSVADTEKLVHDYSMVDPDNLLNHLMTDFKNMWDQRNYLLGWLGYWLVRKDRGYIYRTLKNIVDKLGTRALSGDIFDLIYPLAYEFDSSVAFDFLCQAQEKDYGWQRYWADKKKAVARWKFLKEKFPQRYLEFFQMSTNQHVPLSRGVEFLFMFGDSNRAEMITEASLQFAESLMADTGLQSPEWLSRKGELTEVDDILIQRLLWPGPLVRERAASAIANLLCSGKTKEMIFNKLLLWMQQQKMESIIAIGLLPIIKAFYTAEKPEDLQYIDVGTIAKSVPVNSEVIENLFNELCSLTGNAKPVLPSFANIELVPSAYSPKPFFSKYASSFLAPIYMQRAEEIGKNCQRSFIRQWAFTFDAIIKDSGIDFDSNQLYYYGRTENDDFLTGFSSKISEAYRSAFLRVLQHFYMNAGIPKDFYLQYAYDTLPVELSMWKILPGRAPEWWPRLAQLADAGDEEQKIVAISIADSLEKLVESRDGKTLLAAEGAVQPAEGWALGDPSHSFLLMGFGYKVVGSEWPTAEEIAKALSYAPTLVTIPSRTSKPFNFLEDGDNHLAARCEIVPIKDVVICPIVVREHDLCIAIWQYFRDYDAAFNLNPSLSQNLAIVLDRDNWQLRDKKGNRIAIYADWLEGLKERYNRDMPLPHGHSLIIDKDFLDNWLNGQNMRLGYILKTTYRTRKYNYENVRKYEDTMLLNVSRIIL